MKLEGQVVLVTGASQGLGREMATAFVDAGASVACAARTEETLEEAVEDMSGPGEVMAVTADVRSWEEVRRMVDGVVDEFGRIDVLVNNAGVQEPWLTGGREPRVAEFPIDVWDTVLETNLRGAFLCTRAVLPGMLERDAGQLIHLSSGMGQYGRAGRAAYAASKHGLEGLHQSLALELEETNLQSVVLEPGGGVDTHRFSAHLDEAAREDRLRPGVIVDPALRLAAGEGENGGRYVATEEW